MLTEWSCLDSQVFVCCYSSIATSNILLWIVQKHIHPSFQVPNAEIVAVENLHLNVYFTKQNKLTTENAMSVYKQTI